MCIELDTLEIEFFFNKNKIVQPSILLNSSATWPFLIGKVTSATSTVAQIT